MKKLKKQLLEGCKQLIWLHSRTERFSGKVGGGGDTEAAEIGHRADSGKK